MIIKQHRNDIFLFIALKLLILWMLPLTGDEAYFLTWGNVLEPGYYDHPPMPGWVVYFFNTISDHYLFYRFITFAISFVVAWMVYLIGMMFVSKDEAVLVALIFFLSPVSLLMFIFTNDMLLILFGTVGVYFFLKALQVEKRAYLFALLAGLMFGMSFLSKYFALFLIAAVFLYALLFYRTKGFIYSVVSGLVVLAFMAQNLVFNCHSCWNNILFNFYSRTSGHGISMTNIAIYLVIVIYLFTPWILYYLIKFTRADREKRFKLFIATMIVVPLVIFFFAGLQNKVGLHWFLLFMPYIFLSIHLIDKQKIKNIYLYTTRFTYGHIGLLLIILFLPVTLLKDHKDYPLVLIFTSPEKICQALPKDETVYTYGYSFAAVLEKHCKQDFHLLFNNSKYGRQDDKRLDVRALKDQNLTVFSASDDSALLSKYFKDLDQTTFDVENIKYYLFKGIGFDYKRYRDDYLTVQKDKFYTIPDWLPKGECYFTDRYFQEK